MNKKLVFGLSAVCVAGAFWACGSGDVVDYDDDLDGLAESVIIGESLGAADVATAITNCKSGIPGYEGCAQEMANAPAVDVPTSSTTGPSQTSSTGTNPTSSNQVQSSSTMFPMSSSPVRPVSSTGPIGTQSSSSVPPPVSSSSGIIPASSSTVGPATSGLGTCGPTSPTVDQGAGATWKFTIAQGTDISVTLSAKYVWTINEDASVKTGSSGSVPNVTYATSGQKTASVAVSTSAGSEVVQCSPLNVNGAAITGCACAAAKTPPDVALGESASWTVSGCKTTANIVSYTWVGATGTAETATAPVAAKNDVVSGVSVTVANDDNTIVNVTCPAVTAMDSRIPDYSLDDQNTAIDLPAGESAVIMNLPSTWHNGTTGTCTFSCSDNTGSGSGTVDGAKLTGSYHLTVSIPITSTIGGYALPVNLSAAMSCQVGW